MESKLLTELIDKPTIKEINHKNLKIDCKKVLNTNGIETVYSGVNLEKNSKNEVTKSRVLVRKISLLNLSMEESAKL
jgi:hypothetical protein